MYIYSICCSLILLPNSCFVFQSDGLKEGDYIVAVGDTDCKWLGVSEVMRLLKDVNEEGIDIQVVSMMDSNPQMVCHALFLSYWLREKSSVWCPCLTNADSKYSLA